MIELSYARLKKISLTNKPYRGSTNRFPIAGRRQNKKYFLAEQENGEAMFKIIYGWVYAKEPVAPEDAAELRTAGKSISIDPDTGQNYLWIQKPFEVGVVRSDNSFEFTASGYHQGANRFLSDVSYGYFSNDSRRGGMVFNSSRNGFYPIHHGMRVDIASMKPTKPITIIGKTVDRKASKKLMAEHQDFFKVAETMCKAMTLGSWLDTAKDIYLEHDIETTSESVTLKLAEAMKSSAPIDAVVLYALGMNIDGFKWKIKNPSSWHHHKEAVDMFNTMKTKLCKQIYKENASTFKTVTYEMGKAYPPSAWGYTLMVDGVEVEQYGYGV